MMKGATLSSRYDCVGMEFPQMLLPNLNFNVTYLGTDDYIQENLVGVSGSGKPSTKPDLKIDIERSAV